MRLLRSSDNSFLFQLGAREKKMLVELLELYPCPRPHQLSKSAALPDAVANQKLLEEALAENQAEHRKHWQTLLADARHLVRTDAGWKLSLQAQELESLLQMLNDIRIGSWVALGSPEDRVQAVDENTAHHLLAMEMAGFFEMNLLAAVQGG